MKIGERAYYKYEDAIKYLVNGASPEYAQNLKDLSEKVGQVIGNTKEWRLTHLFIPLHKDFPSGLWEESFQDTIPNKLRGKGVGIYVPTKCLIKKKTLVYRRKE